MSSFPGNPTVRQTAETVELLLAGSIPEGQLDVDVVDEDVCGSWVSKRFGRERNVEALGGNEAQVESIERREGRGVCRIPWT